MNEFRVAVLGRSTMAVLSTEFAGVEGPSARWQPTGSRRWTSPACRRRSQYVQRLDRTAVSRLATIPRPRGRLLHRPVSEG
jgi:hypothetical protein